VHTQFCVICGWSLPVRIRPGAKAAGARPRLANLLYWRRADEEPKRAPESAEAVGEVVGEEERREEEEEKERGMRREE